MAVRGLCPSRNTPGSAYIGGFGSPSQTSAHPEIGLIACLRNPQAPCIDPGGVRCPSKASLLHRLILSLDLRSDRWLNSGHRDAKGLMSDILALFECVPGSLVDEEAYIAGGIIPEHLGQHSEIEVSCNGPALKMESQHFSASF